MKTLCITLLLTFLLLAIGCKQDPPIEQKPAYQVHVPTAREVLEKMPNTLEAYRSYRGGQMSTDLTELGFGIDTTCNTCRTHPLVEDYMFYYRYDGCWKVEAIPQRETDRKLIVDCTGKVREE